MSDTIGTIRPGPDLVLHIRARGLLDSAGNEALPAGQIEQDIDSASSVWTRIAGITVVAEWAVDWVSDEYFILTDSDHFQDLKAEFWIEGQTWINLFYTSTDSWAAGACSYTVRDYHGIFLTDASTDEWRGTALAHEIGHYLDLHHTKDAAEVCPDVDKSPLDSGNLMAQGADGRTPDPDLVHLTSCQVTNARAAAFALRPNLIAPHFGAVVG